MRLSLGFIRASERRAVWTAFFILFGVIASHALLETARDALFLARASAEQLPWVYIAIAFATLGVSRLQDRYRASACHVLGGWLMGSAAITLGFWLLLDYLGMAGVYLLYVWSGVLVTMVLVHFWTLLGGAFSVTQAKRLYGIIGTGSVLGAIAGSALAGVIASVLSTEYLLVAAAVILFLTSFLAGMLPSGATGERDGNGTKASANAGLKDQLVEVLDDVYARRVVAVVIVSAAALTVGDYLFKSVVAANVPKDELGAYLAQFYLALNVGSLVLQALLVQPLLKRLTVLGSLCVLPFLVLLGSGTALLFVGVIPALLVKGGDGLLKHSLHRTASELIYVPMGTAMRRRVKTLSDVIGQRGGQGVASLVLLLIAAAGLGDRWVAGLLLGLALFWLYLVMRLREPYLDLFRQSLRAGGLRRSTAVPDLDMASFERLIATLNSPSDEDVVAAVELLAIENKAHLIPTLLLYHPSEPVLLTTLDVFGSLHRSDAAPLVQRLLNHESPAVRSAAIVTFGQLKVEHNELIEGALQDPSPQVRASATVALAAAGVFSDQRAEEVVAPILDRGEPEGLVALADAVARAKVPDFDTLLVDLTRSRFLDVRVAATRALRSASHPDTVLQPLLELLATEATRAYAVEVLEELGDPAHQALIDALGSDDTPEFISMHLPDALTSFPTQRSADALLSYVVDHSSGLTRYRAIRCLERVMQIDPTIRLQAESVDSLIAESLKNLHQLQELRVQLAKTPEAYSNLVGATLMQKTVTDKIRQAEGRLVRLLGLRYPAQDFAEIRRGIIGDSEHLRSSSLELLEAALPTALRLPVLAVLDNPERAVQVDGAFHRPTRRTYIQAIDALLRGPSITTRAIAAFHASELRVPELLPALQAMPRHSRTQTDVNHAIGVLESIRPAQDGLAPSLEVVRAV